jgi:hypothetical protein
VRLASELSLSIPIHHSPTVWATQTQQTSLLSQTLSHLFRRYIARRTQPPFFSKQRLTRYTRRSNGNTRYARTSNENLRVRDPRGLHIHIHIDTMVGTLALESNTNSDGFRAKGNRPRRRLALERCASNGHITVELALTHAIEGETRYNFLVPLLQPRELSQRDYRQEGWRW